MIDVYHQQLLLEFLDCTPGKLDGLSGPMTRAATEKFQRDYGFAVTGILDAATESGLRNAVAGTVLRQAAADSWWMDTPHFTREEFRCRCSRCGGFPAEPKEKLVRLAERVRTHFDAPAAVSSGVRCPAHNAEVGGVKNSRHLTGQAMDFCIRGHSAREVTAFAAAQPECAYTYAIDENFVHMDVIA